MVRVAISIGKICFFVKMTDESFSRHGKLLAVSQFYASKKLSPSRASLDVISAWLSGL